MANDLRNRVNARTRPDEQAAPEPREPHAGEISPGAFMTFTVDPPEVVAIHIALARVMAQVRAVGKDGWNENQRFNFRGIDAVVNAVGPALRQHGVLVLPEVLSVERRDVRTSQDKPAREITVTVRYRFIGPAGDELSVTVPGEAMDNGDKAVAKAMSVAFRIALLQALALPTSDPDPDQSTYERAYEPPAPPDPATEARADLFAWVQGTGVDTIAVRKAFARQYGEPIAKVTDAAVIREFASSLRADPDAVLAAPAPEMTDPGPTAPGPTAPDAQ